jgi:hypothetical protein
MLTVWRVNAARAGQGLSISEKSFNSAETVLRNRRGNAFWRWIAGVHEGAAESRHAWRVREVFVRLNGTSDICATFRVIGANRSATMTIRVTVHRINIQRYESLLMGDLTPYERRFLEERIEQERSAMKLLYSQGLPRGASLPSKLTRADCTNS